MIIMKNAQLIITDAGLIKKRLYLLHFRGTNKELNCSYYIDDQSKKWTYVRHSDETESLAWIDEFPWEHELTEHL